MTSHPQDGVCYVVLTAQQHGPGCGYGKSESQTEPLLEANPPRF